MVKMNNTSAFLLHCLLALASAKNPTEAQTSRILGGLESSLSTFSASKNIKANRKLEVSSECPLDQLMVEMDILQGEELLLSKFYYDDYYESASIPDECELSEDDVLMVCEFSDSDFFDETVESCISKGYNNIFIDLHDECNGNTDELYHMPLCLAPSCESDEFLMLMSLEFDETCFQNVTISESQEISVHIDEDSMDQDSTEEVTGSYGDGDYDDSDKDDNSTIVVVMIVGVALIGLTLVGKKILSNRRGETASFSQSNLGQFN